MYDKMAKNNRWGKDFIDNRDWKVYNEEVVKRYEMYLDLDWVKSWDDELKIMNEGKIGCPYQYPNSMIQFQALLVEKFSTRGAEGITRKLEEYKLIPKCNDHATIHRRVVAMDYEFKILKGVKLDIGTDGSGFKMTNGGEYKQNTYGKERRKFAKVIITATKQDVLDVDVFVNGKEVSEPKTAEKHIDNIIKKGGEIKKFSGDGAFDVRSLFNKLEDNAIESAIRIRKNATTKAKGSFRRKKEVKEFKEFEFKEWSEKKSYGHRWPMTEGHFSGSKRTLGEDTRAKKTYNILKELVRKIWIYDRLRKYGRNGMGIEG